MTRVFLQERVWRCLRRNPSSSRTQIAALLKLSPTTVTHKLMALRQTGHAKSVGNARATRWTALGAVPPVDKRGLSPGSIAPLRPSWERWRETLPKAFAAKGVEMTFGDFSAKQISGNRAKFVRERAPERVAIPSLADLAGSLMR